MFPGRSARQCCSPQGTRNGSSGRIFSIACALGVPWVERVSGKTIFERNAQNPKEAELFSEAMASFSAALSAPLMATYDFGSIRRIADIGAGTGRLLADLLAAHKEARGVLFDHPNVVTGATAILAASGVEARCEIVGGSFFDAVPPGADAYVLRAIRVANGSNWNQSGEPDAGTAPRLCRTVIF
jgi:O-methyltransferase domain